jgi:hypothetical protein
VEHALAAWKKQKAEMDAGAEPNSDWSVTLRDAHGGIQAVGRPSEWHRVTLIDGTSIWAITKIMQVDPNGGPPKILDCSNAPIVPRQQSIVGQRTTNVAYAHPMVQQNLQNQHNQQTQTAQANPTLTSGQGGPVHVHDTATYTDSNGATHTESVAGTKTDGGVTYVTAVWRNGKRVDLTNNGHTNGVVPTRITGRALDTTVGQGGRGATPEQQVASRGTGERPGQRATDHGTGTEPADPATVASLEASLGAKDGSGLSAGANDVLTHEGAPKITPQEQTALDVVVTHLTKEQAEILRNAVRDKKFDATKLADAILFCRRRFARVDIERYRLAQIGFLLGVNLDPQEQSCRLDSDG